MTSRELRTLEDAVAGRGDYFRTDPTKAIDYVRHVIAPALGTAVSVVKGDLLSDHDVDTATTPSVVHYTSLPALFAMIHEGPELRRASEDRTDDQRPTDNRFLRLYDSANLNDPSEGTYFLQQLTKAYSVVKVPAYIASFVTPDDAAEDSANTRDNLVFWRHYGSDGRGCSISIPIDRLVGKRSTLRLRTVAYGRGRAKKDAAELKRIVGRLEPVVEDAQADDNLERQVAAMILESLEEIPYLYKSDAYKYERECRLVALESHFKHHGGIRYAFEKWSGASGRLRMYGQHPNLSLTNILSTGSIITLGPAVPNADHVQYAIEQLLESVGIAGLPVKLSSITYRRTS